MKAKDLIKKLTEDFEEKYNKAMKDYEDARKNYGEQHPLTCEKAGYFFAMSHTRVTLLISTSNLED